MLVRKLGKALNAVSDYWLGTWTRRTRDFIEMRMENQTLWCGAQC